MFLSLRSPWPLATAFQDLAVASFDRSLLFLISLSIVSILVIVLSRSSFMSSKVVLCVVEFKFLVRSLNLSMGIIVWWNVVVMYALCSVRKMVLSGDLSMCFIIVCA